MKPCSESNQSCFWQIQDQLVHIRWLAADVGNWSWSYGSDVRRIICVCDTEPAGKSALLVFVDSPCLFVVRYVRPRWAHLSPCAGDIQGAWSSSLLPHLPFLVPLWRYMYLEPFWRSIKRSSRCGLVRICVTQFVQFVLSQVDQEGLWA